MSNRFHATVYLSLFISKQCIIKQFIRFGFCDIWNNQGLSKSWQPRPLVRLIKLTSTLIIPDITKTSSKLFIVSLFSQNTNFLLVFKWILSWILLKWPLPGLYKNALKALSRAYLRRRLILHKIGLPRCKFFTPYFIDGQVFFRIFTFSSPVSTVSARNA